MASFPEPLSRLKTGDSGRITAAEASLSLGVAASRASPGPWPWLASLPPITPAASTKRVRDTVGKVRKVVSC